MSPNESIVEAAGLVWLGEFAMVAQRPQLAEGVARKACSLIA